MRDSKAEMARREKLQAALQELRKKKGVSVRSLARKYGIPPSTLHRHARMESRIGVGRPTILTPEEEEEVVYSCQVLQEMGFGMTREMVGAIVVDYVPYNHWQRQPIQWTAWFHSTLQPFLKTRLFHPLQSPEMSVSPQQ